MQHEAGSGWQLAGAWRRIRGDGSSRWVRWALAALLVWGVVLRVWLALPNPTPTRFWDERYSVQNVYRLAATGELRPANGYHPALSYLPQALVIAAVERALGEGSVVRPPRQGRLTPLGYRLCRLVQVAYAAASVLLLFLLARKLLGATGGLAAAWLLLVTPWHLRQSVIFKPDILLILMTVAVLLGSVRVLERPSTVRVLVLGATLGASLASKFNAAPLVVPAALAVVVAGLREGRHGARLARDLAALALASALVLLAISPYLALEPSLYRQDFAVTLDDYEVKAERVGATGWSMPAHAVRSLAGWNFHGPAVSTLALVGLLLPANPRARAVLSRLHQDAWLVLSSFFIAYVGLYALVTANPSPHNWLVLSPVICIVGGAVVSLLVDALSSRLGPSLFGRRCAMSIVVLLMLLVSWPAHRWAYLSGTPTTAELAESLISEQIGGSRDRIVGSAVPLRPTLAGHAVQDRTLDAASRALILPLDEPLSASLASESITPGHRSAYGLDRIRGLDALVLRATDAPSSLLTDLEELGYEIRTVHPTLGHSRGDELIVATRVFRLVERSSWRETRSGGELGLDRAPPGRWVSLEVASAGRPLDLVLAAEDAASLPCEESNRGGARSRCIVVRSEGELEGARLVSRDGKPSGQIGFRVLAWEER